MKTVITLNKRATYSAQRVTISGESMVILKAHDIESWEFENEADPYEVGAFYLSAIGNVLEYLGQGRWRRRGANSNMLGNPVFPVRKVLDLGPELGNNH